MNIIYSRLFEIQLKHNYFADGLAKGLKIIPTTETQQQLQKGRMLYREVPSRAVILYRAQDDLGTPSVALSPNTDFYFYLLSENPSFLWNVTELKEGSRNLGQGELLAFANDPSASSQDDQNPETISMKIWDGLKPKQFSQRLTLAPAPSQAILKVSDPEGNLIPSGMDESGNPLPLNLDIFPNSEGEFTFTINLSQRAQNKYLFTIRDQGDTIDLWSKTYFLTDDFFGNKALGVIKLSYLDGQNSLYGAREYYALDFRRKSTKWKYYVVSQNSQVDLSSAKVSIKDQGNGPGLPYGVYDFDQIGTAPSTDTQINNADTVIFKSQVPIPFFERPKLNLQLRRKPGNRVLLDHLPNPISSGVTKVAPGEEISEIYVYI